MSSLRLLPHPWPDIIHRVGQPNLYDQSALERHPEIVALNKSLIEAGISTEGAEVAVMWDRSSPSAGGRCWRAFLHAVGPVDPATGKHFEEIWRMKVPAYCDPYFARKKGCEPRVPTVEDIASHYERHSTKQESRDAVYGRLAREKAALEKEWATGKGEDLACADTDIIAKAARDYADKQPTRGWTPERDGKGIEPQVEPDPEKQAAEEAATAAPDLAERLKAALIAIGVSERDFAVDRGVSNATVYNWLKKGIPASRVEEIEAYLAANEPKQVEA